VCRSADSSFVFHLRFYLRFKTLLQMLE
jgi:hypothetical protein